MRPLEPLPFQNTARQQLYDAVMGYDPSINLFSVMSGLPEIKPGEPKPYLHRLKAVTGAGKTPILVSLASQLKDAIVLWTTPRSAVISQTINNLRGKYSHLLPSDVDVLELGKVTAGQWQRVMESETGLALLVATVASFNQEGDNLKLHQGNPSRWTELKGVKYGGRRKRRLFVFYDEGHNATANQFARLLELRPFAFILASASDLSQDLYPLIPGEDNKAKEQEYNHRRTTVIPTKEVVVAGLLKGGIEIFDCDLPWQEIVRLAVEKVEYLATLSKETIIGCFIVDRTDKGLDVWSRLISLGVPADKIAVHLNNASAVARQKYAGAIPDGFHDTYGEELTPRELKEKGYTHIIWNLTLKEGWDEPWAYVAYIHDSHGSVTDIEQKIGRFIRNPFQDDNGAPKPAADPDLNKAYFYFNVGNELFSRVLDQLKSHLEVEGYEVLKIKRSEDDKTATIVEPKRTTSIPRMYILPKTTEIRRELLNGLVVPSEEDRISPGMIRTGIVDLKDLATTTPEPKTLGENLAVSAADMLKDIIEYHDFRLVRAKGSTGAWLDPSVWTDPKMNYAVCYNSAAHQYLKQYGGAFAQRALEYLDLRTVPGSDFEVPAFKMNNPGGGDSERTRFYYRVQRFTNSMHPEYNGFNKFELAFALELDEVGVLWMRNPARYGYGIPLLKPSKGSTEFYPDFVAFYPAPGVTFFEPKGPTLLADAIKEKLFPLPTGFRLFLVAEGECSVNRDSGAVDVTESACYTRIHLNDHAKYVSRTYDTLGDLIRETLC